MYKWNSKCNCFQPYEKEYKTVTQNMLDGEGNPLLDENGNPQTEEVQVEIEPTVTVYTQEQVNTILSEVGANQGLKDLDGAPVVVNLYTQSELTALENAKQLSALKNWFNTEYRTEFEKAYRLTVLEKSYSHYDAFRDKTYMSLNDLFVEGEIVRAEIQELEN